MTPWYKERDLNAEETVEFLRDLRRFVEKLAYVLPAEDRKRFHAVLDRPDKGVKRVKLDFTVYEMCLVREAIRRVLDAHTDQSRHPPGHDHPGATLRFPGPGFPAE